MYSIAASGAAVALTTVFFQGVDSEGRLRLKFGTISNANDLAAVLILLLPFLLWAVVASGMKATRVLAAGLFFVGLYAILHTGSRGSFVALIIAMVFSLWRANLRQKLLILFAISIIATLSFAVIPRALLQRTVELSSGEALASADQDEAMQSQRTRMTLFWKSVEYTFQFPLLGVGPGQFAEYEGQHNIRQGYTHGIWQNTHNTFTQISSECGIPALLFYVASLIASFRLLNGVYREAKKRSSCSDIQATAGYTTLALTAFIVAIAFLNFAYSIYVPSMIGLAVVIARSSREELRLRAV
jgi:O-antigen ligase